MKCAVVPFVFGENYTTIKNTEFHFTEKNIPEDADQSVEFCLIRLRHNVDRDVEQKK